MVSPLPWKVNVASCHDFSPLLATVFCFVMSMRLDVVLVGIYENGFGRVAAMTFFLDFESGRVEEANVF